MAKSYHNEPRYGRRIKTDGKSIQACGCDPGILFRGWRKAIPVHTTARQAARRDIEAALMEAV